MSFVIREIYIVLFLVIFLILNELIKRVYILERFIFLDKVWRIEDIILEFFIKYIV